ncbi:hypothetical protein SEA_REDWATTLEHOG_57 [Gordonia phage RedWattleHog]|uniref:Uncharacterized protein n=1 Tax=Gordonia phage Stormageddon TaxID=2656541 RepID=A0A649VQZ0_9CAUD|nr:hypothetical protein KHQ86_gp054 [Gordonia phage Stormageddon]QGJ94917.1 hypothetical protein SEA_STORMAGEDDON_54 [Gordonia phage Stormageddon]QLF83561.1 hypothetical protein SEA_REDWATTLEHOG_57 [Gordonia phage RedWattleHog]
MKLQRRIKGFSYGATVGGYDFNIARHEDGKGWVVAMRKVVHDEVLDMDHVIGQPVEFTEYESSLNDIRGILKHFEATDAPYVSAGERYRSAWAAFVEADPSFTLH